MLPLGRKSCLWAAVVTIGVVTLLSTARFTLADHGVDSMFKTTNTPWNCIDGGTTPNGGNCQNDNAGVEYCTEASISMTGRSTISSMLSGQFAPTDLTITLEASCDYSGGSETDIVYQQLNNLGLAGVAWCDDSNNSTQCDQHYVAFDISSPTSNVVCHESGHAVGLTHGSQAGPAQSDSSSSFGCMRTPVFPSYTTLGTHNVHQINALYN